MKSWQPRIPKISIRESITSTTLTTPGSARSSGIVVGSTVSVLKAGPHKGATGRVTSISNGFVRLVTAAGDKVNVRPKECRLVDETAAAQEDEALVTAMSRKNVGARAEWLWLWPGGGHGGVLMWWCDGVVAWWRGDVVT